jgi:hypothetical protein
MSEEEDFFEDNNKVNLNPIIDQQEDNNNLNTNANMNNLNAQYN